METPEQKLERLEKENEELKASLSHCQGTNRYLTGMPDGDYTPVRYLKHMKKLHEKAGKRISELEAKIKIENETTP